MFRSLICFYAMFLLSSSSYAQNSQRSFLSPQEILSGWQKTYGGVNSIYVSYSSSMEATLLPGSDPRFHDLVKYEQVERTEQGRRYHMRYSIAKEGFSRPEDLMEHAFNGQITREYWGQNKSGSLVKGLTGRNVEIMNDFNEYLLLNQSIKKGFVLSGRPVFVELFDSKFLIKKVLPNQEDACGEPCHVVEFYDGKKSSVLYCKVWVAQDKGMIPLKCFWYRDGRPYRQVMVEKIGMVKTDTGFLWYPTKVRDMQEREKIGRLERDFVTHAFVPNVKTDDGTWTFKFPDGTHVVDNVAEIQYVVGADDPEKLKLQALDSPTGQNQATPPATHSKTPRKAISLTPVSIQASSTEGRFSLWLPLLLMLAFLIVGVGVYRFAKNKRS